MDLSRINIFQMLKYHITVSRDFVVSNEIK